MFWGHKWYLVSCFLIHFYFVLISCFLRLRAYLLLLLIVCVSEIWILSCQPMRRYSVHHTFFCNLFILHLWIGSLMQLPMLKSGSFLGMSDVCKGVGCIMQCRIRQGCFNAWMPTSICCPTRKIWEQCYCPLGQAWRWERLFPLFFWIFCTNIQQSNYKSRVWNVATFFIVLSLETYQVSESIFGEVKFPNLILCQTWTLHWLSNQ